MVDTHFPTAFIDHLTESLYLWNKKFVFTLILTPVSLPSPVEQSRNLLFMVSISLKYSFQMLLFFFQATRVWSTNLFGSVFEKQCDTSFCLRVVMRGKVKVPVCVLVSYTQICPNVPCTSLLIHSGRARNHWSPSPY